MLKIDIDVVQKLKTEAMTRTYTIHTNIAVIRRDKREAIAG